MVSILGQKRRVRDRISALEEACGEDQYKQELGMKNDPHIFRNRLFQLWFES